MPLIRIFLCTYRRPVLLRRALRSLLDQTLSDWSCELHNDAPDDVTPRDILHELAPDDPRFTYCPHATNWGAVATFNHVYAGGPEPFASLLEDDNWWEPAFLATALAALAAHPTAHVAWANLRISQEHPDGTWTDTGRTIWTVPPGDSRPRRFHWPQPLQFFSALHSNGAMLFRVGPSRAALVPAATPFAIIEPVRERLLGGDWLLLPAPLGHFALTLQTARPLDRTSWNHAQLLVGGTYLAASPIPSAEIAGLWEQLRSQKPPGTTQLFQLALAGIRPFALLIHARPGDWWVFLKGAVRHPLLLIRALRFRSAFPVLWPALCAAAAARTRENATLLPCPALYRKHLPPDP
jgi:glycosyltransferase involved in cell wall biosynthesis